MPDSLDGANIFQREQTVPGFGKCQAKDFDAQIVDTTTMIIQHILLTLKFRFEHIRRKKHCSGMSERGKFNLVWIKNNGGYSRVDKTHRSIMWWRRRNGVVENLLMDEQEYQMIKQLLLRAAELQIAAYKKWKSQHIVILTYGILIEIANNLICKIQ